MEPAWILIAAILGAFIGFLGTFLTTWYSNKKATERFRKQLYYREKKDVLFKLYKLLRDDLPYHKFKEKLEEIIHGIEGEYLSNTVRQKIIGEIYDLEKFIEEISPVPDFSSRDEEMILQNERETLESMDPIEKYEYKLGEHFEQSKNKIENIIREAITR